MYSISTSNQFSTKNHLNLEKMESTINQALKTNSKTRGIKLFLTHHLTINILTIPTKPNLKYMQNPLWWINPSWLYTHLFANLKLELMEDMGRH